MSVVGVREPAIVLAAKGKASTPPVTSKNVAVARGPASVRVARAADG